MHKVTTLNFTCHSIFQKIIIQSFYNNHANKVLHRPNLHKFLTVIYTVKIIGWDRDFLMACSACCFGNHDNVQYT